MRTLIKVLGTLFVVNFSTVLQAETLSEAMQACSRVDNSLKRLVCFDRLAQRANGMQDMELPEFVERQRAIKSYSAPNADYPVTPQPRVSDAESEFGMQKDQRDALSEIVATVRKIEKFGKDRLLITLDNGQVWRQSTGDTLQNLRVGEAVIISKGMMGAFYLKEQGSKKRILVKRSS